MFPVSCHKVIFNFFTPAKPSPLSMPILCITPSHHLQHLPGDKQLHWLELKSKLLEDSCFRIKLEPASALQHHLIGALDFFYCQNKASDFSGGEVAFLFRNWIGQHVHTLNNRLLLSIVWISVFFYVGRPILYFFRNLSSYLPVTTSRTNVEKNETFYVQ